MFSHRWLCITTRGIIFLCAGALGNLSDRLMYGYVVDWIYVGGYINLADVWLGVGSFLILARCVRMRKTSKRT